MRRILMIALLGLMSLLFLKPGVVLGQKLKLPATLDSVVDDPKLPRVLIIGDSISIGYTPPLRELLRGKANVHHNTGNAAHTKNGVANLKDWLGTGKWDVIHVNFGLHDLKIEKDDSNQVPIADYEKNLRSIVKDLKATGAKVIWCSTTPVPDGKLAPPRKNSDVEAYNTVAKKIMEENSVPIDDLYAFAAPQLKDIQIPQNVHFTGPGSVKLAGKVGEEILKALGK